MQSSQKFESPPQPQATQNVCYSENASNYYAPYYAPHQVPIVMGSYSGQMVSPYQHFANPNTTEVPEVKGLAFSTESIRKGFIRKVYSILLVILNTHLTRMAGKWWNENSNFVLSFKVQLLITLGSVLLFTYFPSVEQFAVDNIWILLTGAAVVFVTFFTLMCCQNVRYLWPYNLIVLFIFTGALSYMVGIITLIARPELVIEN